MADSIRKRIVDAVIARLGGDGLPPELAGVKISKNRNAPLAPADLPAYAVYFLHNAPKAIGDPRRATLNLNTTTIEVRVIVNGNDDEADAHCQWIAACLGSADRLVDTDGTQLALSVVEAETFFETLEGSKEERTVTRNQWVVEYQSLRADMTRTA